MRKYYTITSKTIRPVRSVNTLYLTTKENKYFKVVYVALNISGMDLDTLSIKHRPESCNDLARMYNKNDIWIHLQGKEMKKRRKFLTNVDHPAYELTREQFFKELV